MQITGIVYRRGVEADRIGARPIQDEIKLEREGLSAKLDRSHPVRDELLHLAAEVCALGRDKDVESVTCGNNRMPHKNDLETLARIVPIGNPRFTAKVMVGSVVFKTPDNTPRQPGQAIKRPDVEVSPITAD